MEAIVLCGGFGTRLSHIVRDVPKPMAPVRGRPFLRYILDDLQKKGVERVVLAVGYKKECIEDFFGPAYRGMELLYSPEESPLGTGGALKKALSLCRGERVLALNGDTYFDMDLSAMQAAAAPLVLAVKRLRDFSRYGTVVLAGDRVVGFREKGPCAQGLINGGVYLLERRLLEDMPARFSFETDFLEKRCGALGPLAVESEGYFIDIGVPEDYALAQETLRDLAPQNGAAAFFDRDGTINVDVRYLHRPEDLRFVPGMPEFIRQWNDWGYKVVVLTNQAGIARGYYTAEDMRALHRYMNGRLSEHGAHIDAFYFCPHHPDLTGPCRCRKPEPGLLLDALRDFELSPARCILFGDQPWDLECARRAGVFGVQVPRWAEE